MLSYRLIGPLLASLTLGLTSCGLQDPPEDFSPCTAAEGDGGLSITDLSVEGEELVVEVQHAAGCGDHQFAICWPDPSFEGNPTSTRFEIWHDDGRERCEAEQTRRLRFPLGPVLEAYVDEFGGAGILELNIEDLSASYDFDM